jgi:transposase-like protein
MKVEMICPTCGSHDISKNGTTRRGKQNYKCRDYNLQTYVNICYELVPKAATVTPKAKGKLQVQMDELWSFVDHKGNKQWV